jgi:hypothetical protein
MEFDGFFQIKDGFIDCFTKAGDVNVQALRDIVGRFLVDAKFDGSHECNIPVTPSGFKHALNARVKWKASGVAGLCRGENARILTGENGE